MSLLRTLSRPFVRLADSRPVQRGGAFAFLGGLVWGVLKIASSEFPTAPLILTAVGAGLLGASVAVPLLTRAGLIVEPPPAPPPAPPNPYAQAGAISREHRALAVRKAARHVREELLDNKHVLERTLTGEAGSVESLRTNAWRAEREVLIEADDPAPHTTASAAYREIGALSLSQLRRIDYHVLETDPDAAPPDVTVAKRAIATIDAAVSTLEAAESEGAS